VAGAILLGFVMSWWVSARVSRPLARLAGGIDEVASGDWDTRLEACSGGEIGLLLGAFNRMTDRLTDERARILTAERVAAWREMAQQLAREVHAGITPLQKAAERLGRARDEDSEEFDEVFSESLATLRVELRILQAAAEGLADFSRPPARHSEALRINDVVRTAVKSFEPQFCAIGRPPITPELYLDDELAPVRGNPVRLRKAIEGLVYRALVDMPAGGTLTVRTKQQGNMAHLVISDTGRGFEIENPSRIFSMQPLAGAGHAGGTGPMVGEGLLLATVQAIVCDHGGRISVESAPGAGTTFFLDLPAAAVENAPRRNAKPKATTSKTTPREAEASAAAAIIELASELTAEPTTEGTSETRIEQTFAGASEPASEAVFELTSEMPHEPMFEEDLEYESEAEAPREPEAEAVGQACLDFVAENEAKSPFGEPMDAKPPLEMTEVEVAWQMLEAMHIEGPSEEFEEDAAEHHAQFLADTTQDLPLDENDDVVLLQEIVAAPALDDAQSQEQFEERPELKTQSAEAPSAPSLDALDEMLEAKRESAPEESLEKATEEVPAKTEEKGFWRSPLTYR
jgi:signal transduction histidine kinase